MSSNITVQKACEFCGQKFTAKTLFTRYCSKRCNNRHYKQLVREKKAKVPSVQLASTVAPTLNNQAQDYCEVNEAAQIMRISIRTLYRIIAMKNSKEETFKHAQ
jgi:hypothetical protein